MVTGEADAEGETERFTTTDTTARRGEGRFTAEGAEAAEGGVGVSPLINADGRGGRGDSEGSRSSVFPTGGS